MTVAALSVRGLNKWFGSLHALKDVSLEVAQGEFFALLGPNGAGKTTLISILAGLTRADGGEARIMGHCVQREYRQARRLLGVVPQELAFDPFLTVRETLQIQSGYFGLRRNDAWIDEILVQLGLQDKANSNMRALSGGMKRRVLVAQALVHKPPVIILDEPTAGVDVELRQSLWQFIRQLNRDGHTIILTTHYLEEAESLCERIAMLKLGQIVALDRTSNLLRSGGELHLEIRLDRTEVPATLQARARSLGERRFGFRLSCAAEIEPVLAAVREAGGEIEDISLRHPDLEDIFVQIMERA